MFFYRMSTSNRAINKVVPKIYNHAEHWYCTQTHEHKIRRIHICSQATMILSEMLSWRNFSLLLGTDFCASWIQPTS